jgi:putative hydrolase of the HAD superfamily
METQQLADYFSSEVRLNLGELYGTNRERAEFTLSFYRYLYALPTLEFDDYVTHELFEYCKRREFFVVILAFQDRRVFLKRILHDKLLWQLPGSSVRSAGMELFEDSVSRILQSDIPRIEMSELQPVAVLRKTYHFGKDYITHHGLAFMGRVRSPEYAEIELDENIKGRFVSLVELAERVRLSKFDQMLVSLGAQLLSSLSDSHIDAIDQEIESTDTVSNFVWRVHDTVVRPLGKRFSSKLIKREILKEVDAGSRILDVACGDDDFIYELASKARICVGNDIHWNQIKKLAAKGAQYRKNIIFTNHDACELPFKFKFDLAICKNLLHHLSELSALQGLLSSLAQVSHRVLIIDPEEPKEGGFRSKIWNAYYRKILKDQGQHFYTRELFEQLLREFFGSQGSVRFKYLYTIKGTYMFCHADLRSLDSSNVKSGLDEGGLETRKRPSKSGQPITTLIFDLDGLLVDTEQVFYGCIRDALALFGVQTSVDQYVNRDLQNGTSLVDYLQSTGLISDRAKVEEVIYDSYRVALTKELRVMPHAVSAVKRLSKDYRLALASSSRREFVDYILKRIGLESTFESIVTREDTAKVKPDPECFLNVLQGMNLNAGDCLVVEDSLRGVRAAQALSIRVVVVPNNLTAGGDYGDVFTLDSLRQLTTELISKLGR